MGFSKNQACLSILVALSLFVSGCGGDSEEEVGLTIIEGPPQITITLHSKLELEFSLDPDLQPQVADTDKVGDAEPKVVDASAKKKRRRQARLLPVVDPEYQAIQRYETMDPELYTITIKKSPEKPGIRETVKVQDKPLIFAGRGYNISVFEKEAKPAIDVDYTTHLLATLPEPPARETSGHLDPEAGYSRDTKFLVYNSTRSAFGELPPPLSESKPELPQKTEPVSLPERNPDSVLLFPPGEKSFLVLRKAEKQFDLLAGNESLNMKQFKASKVPETSKKISNSPK